MLQSNRRKDFSAGSADVTKLTTFPTCEATTPSCFTKCLGVDSCAGAVALIPADSNPCGKLEPQQCHQLKKEDLQTLYGGFDLDQVRNMAALVRRTSAGDLFTKFKGKVHPAKEVLDFTLDNETNGILVSGALP